LGKQTDPPLFLIEIVIPIRRIRLFRYFRCSVLRYSTARVSKRLRYSTARVSKRLRRRVNRLLRRVALYR